MHIPNSTRRGHRRPLAIALAAAFALALPLPALAQEAEESPAEATESVVAAEVEAEGIVFPVMLGGQLLAPETYSGSEWLELFSGDEPDPAFIEGTQELLDTVGKTVDDVTVKTALYEPVAGEAAVVLALRIEDTDAREWVEGAVDLLVADVIEPGLVMRPLGTKWSLRVTDATMPGVYPRTVYLKDDTAWFVQGDNEFVGDALSQLPDPEPVGASTADSLLTDMPITLDGQRRSGLWELTEPFGLPTLGERLGEDIEGWLLDLYLEAGISPSQWLGVITWWGLDPGQDGLQIEGYRLPDGGEALTQQLLEELFLVRPPEVPSDPEGPLEFDAANADIAALLAGVEFSEQEIAGQMVTTLDYGGSTQHIYSSADTIWVISDPLGERDLVEEAIETLP